MNRHRKSPWSGATRSAARADSSGSRKAQVKRWFPLWILALMLGMAIVTVWLRLSIVRTTYAIDQTDRQLRAVSQAHEQMELKLAAFRSPRRLEWIARSKFGLSPPKSQQIVNMSAEIAKKR